MNVPFVHQLIFVFKSNLEVRSVFGAEVSTRQS